MKVLVTGGRGMVGHAVQAAADPNTDAYYAGTADADLRDPAACRALFERVRPTHVLHLAARVGGVLENSRYLAEFFHDNLLLNANVLDAAHRAGVVKVVSLLSSCVYPDGAPLPLREVDLHSGEPHASNFGYAYAKRMLEVQSRAYRQQYDSRFVCLIPNNLYGPHDTFSLDGSHVIPALIRKVHAAAKGGPPPVLWGDGTPLREFTFSLDLGRALWWALGEYDGPPLNVGANEEVSIRRVAELVCEHVGYDAAKLVWDPTKPKGQHRKPTDTTRFHTLSGMAMTPLAEGVRATIAWYVENFPNVRGMD